MIMANIDVTSNYIALMEAVIEQAKRDSINRGKESSNFSDNTANDADWFLESDFRKSMELWINWYHHRNKPDSYSAAIPD